MFSSSMILLRPKSVILISPLTDPLPRRMFPVKYRINTLMTVKYTTNHSNISTNLSLNFPQGYKAEKWDWDQNCACLSFMAPEAWSTLKNFFNHRTSHLVWGRSESQVVWFHWDTWGRWPSARWWTAPPSLEWICSASGKSQGRFPRSILALYRIWNRKENQGIERSNRSINALALYRIYRYRKIIVMAQLTWVK